MDWMSNWTVWLLDFTSRAASHPYLDAPFGETGNTIIVGAFPIWRPRALSSNSLVARSTKQLVAELLDPRTHQISLPLRHYACPPLPAPWSVEELDVMLADGAPVRENSVHWNGEAVVKAFLAACLAAIVLAAISLIVLNRMQEPADRAFATPPYTRVGD
jgi:hypothetical protein